MADIFSDILKFAGTAITQALTPDTLKDYKHASQLFVADNYKLLPKSGFLFHVFFDINTAAAPYNPGNPNSTSELGLLVKSTDLPKFSFDTKTYNAYNRPNIVQSKVKYEAISISFHDDSSDLIRNFWFDYYNYYYRDSDYAEATYHSAHKYAAVRQTDKWGYSPRDNKAAAILSGKGADSSAGPVPYLNAIRIYSLHNKKFSEYTLINPIIKSFRHGQHTQDSNDFLSHEMSIEYETVLYAYGKTSPSTVKGFAGLHYDKTPSPLSVAGGGTKSILGPGGLMDTAESVINNLPDNPGTAIFQALRGINTAKNMNLKGAALSELSSMGTGIFKGAISSGAASGMGSSVSGGLLTAAAAMAMPLFNKFKTGTSTSTPAVQGTVSAKTSTTEDNAAIANARAAASDRIAQDKAQLDNATVTIAALGNKLSAANALPTSDNKNAIVAEVTTDIAMQQAINDNAAQKLTQDTAAYNAIPTPPEDN